MNLPNQLTCLRILLTFLFVGIVSAGRGPIWTIGLALFIAGAITDFLDGKIARDRGLITSFGKLMDPLADKVLMAGAFVMLCEAGLMPGWAVVAILAREFLVTGIRLLAAAEGEVLPAETLGKYKTTLQIVTVIALLGFLAGQENVVPGSAWLFDAARLGRPLFQKALILGSVFITLWSGLGYLRAAGKFLRDI